MARTEIGRREKYMDMLESQIGQHHSSLVTLVKQCLNDNPDIRPKADELLTSLQRMRVEVEGEYCTNPIRLDLTRMRLAKIIKVKDQRIEELIQLQVKV